MIPMLRIARIRRFSIGSFLSVSLMGSRSSAEGNHRSRPLSTSPGRDFLGRGTRDRAMNSAVR
jgi:hypothetical protein